MKFDINDFRTDEDKQTTGVWIDFGGGASFKLASLENPIFLEEFRKATKPYTDLGREVPADEQEDIMLRLVASHIILDWKGVFDGDDELPYSFDNAHKLVTEIKWVRDRILMEAKNIANFKADQREATSGNSESA
jgi:hypothetical protein